MYLPPMGPRKGLGVAPRDTSNEALGQGIGASPILLNPRVFLFETFSVHCDSAAGDAGHAYEGESWVGHSRLDGLPVCQVITKTLRERMGATPIPLNPRVFLSGTLAHAATWRSPLRRRPSYSGRGRPLLRAALQGGITFHSASARRTLPSPWDWLYVVQSSRPKSARSDGVAGVLWRRAAGAEQMRRVG